MKITLKSARINKGLSRDEAAKGLGVSKDTLYNMETGRTKVSVDLLPKIEQVYGVEYDNLSFYFKNTELS